MSGDRPFRLSEQEMRGMLRRDMTELVSGFIPEPGAEELGALLEFVGACATSRAAAQDAVSKTLALLEDLALVADDQSWAPLRERLEERLKGAMGLREALFNYLPTTGPVEGLREGLLRERVEKALGLRESGEAQPDPLAGQSHSTGRLLFKGPGNSPETGIWVCTPGIWRLTIPRDEFCHFVAGRVVYRRADSDEVIEATAGTCVLFPAGWAGTAEVIETIRTIYMLV